MDVSAVQLQVQTYVQKQAMDIESTMMQNLLSGLPQPAPVQVGEPGKGQNVDIRI